MTATETILASRPLLLLRDGGSLREGVARRHGRRWNWARTTPRTTPTNTAHKHPQAWCEKSRPLYQRFRYTASSSSFSEEGRQSIGGQPPWAAANGPPTQPREWTSTPTASRKPPMLLPTPEPPNDPSGQATHPTPTTSPTRSRPQAITPKTAKVEAC